MNQRPTSVSSLNGMDVVVVQKSWKRFPSGKSKVLKRLLFVDENYMDGSDFQTDKFKNSFDESTAPLDMDQESLDDSVNAHHDERQLSNSPSPIRISFSASPTSFRSGSSKLECSDTDDSTSSGGDGLMRSSHQNRHEKNTFFELNSSTSRRKMPSFLPNKSGSAISRLVRVLEKRQPDRVEDKLLERGRSSSRRWTTNSTHRRTASKESKLCDAKNTSDWKSSENSSEEAGSSGVDSKLVRLAENLTEEFCPSDSSLESLHPPLNFKYSQTKLPELVDNFSRSLIIPRTVVGYVLQREMQAQRVDLAFLLAKALELQHQCSPTTKQRKLHPLSQHNLKRKWRFRPNQRNSALPPLPRPLADISFPYQKISSSESLLTTEEKQWREASLRSKKKRVYRGKRKSIYRELVDESEQEQGLLVSP